MVKNNGIVSDIVPKNIGVVQHLCNMCVTFAPLRGVKISYGSASYHVPVVLPTRNMYETYCFKISVKYFNVNANVIYVNYQLY